LRVSIFTVVNRRPRIAIIFAPRESAKQLWSFCN
jgi:hypothetical protein